MKKIFHHLSFRNLIITQILTKKHIVISCNLILSSYNWGKQQISILLYKFLMLHKWVVFMIKAIWWEIKVTRNKFEKRENENISLSIVYDSPSMKNTGASSHSLGSFPPRDQTWVFYIAGRFFYRVSYKGSQIGMWVYGKDYHFQLEELGMVIEVSIYSGT